MAESAHTKRVLILGASSAIAADIARLYAQDDARLHLIGRSEEKLAALARELGEGVTLRAGADFAELERIDGWIKEGIAALGGLDIALIAHGLIGDQLLSERDPEEAQRIIAANFASAVAMLIPLANHFEAQGEGHIVVLSSVAGERGRPRNYSYGSAKGALTLYLQGVRSRLWPKVGVHTIKLGPVHTPMTLDHPKNALFADSPGVARQVLRIVEHGSGEAYVPWFWRPIMFVVRNCPEPLYQRIGFFSGR